MRALAMAAAACLAGCAAVGGPGEAVVMRVSPVFDAPAGPVSEDQVAVARVQAPGLTADRRYAYVQAASPGVLAQAATLFWERAPAEMTEQALIRALRTRFRTVDRWEAMPAPARRVTARLRRFEEEQAPDGASAIIAFEASVGGPGAAPPVHRDYCGRAPIAAGDPAARAAAFQQALSSAALALTADMAGDASTSPGC